MRKMPRTPPPVDAHQLVLDAIRKGWHTWDEIVAATKLNNDSLGLIFMDLLTKKRVKVEHLNGVRKYRLL